MTPFPPMRQSSLALLVDTQETPLDLSQAQRHVSQSFDSLRVSLKKRGSESPRPLQQTVTFTHSPFLHYNRKSGRLSNTLQNPLPPPRRYTRTKPSLRWDTRTGETPPMVPLMSIRALSPTQPGNRRTGDPGRQESCRSTVRGFGTRPNDRVPRRNPEPRPPPASIERVRRVRIDKAPPASIERVRRVRIDKAPPDYNMVPPPPIYNKVNLSSESRRRDKHANTRTQRR